MEWSELKLDLVQLLINTEDKEVLEQVRRLLDPQHDYVVPEWQKQLVMERKAKYEGKPVEGLSIEELEQQIRSRK
ncbi:hypothetical protein BH09BAC1_BH09BAC1_05160 [soil metagenome]